MKTLLLALLVLAFAPLALAQGDAPQDSDYDTAPPADDASYADASAAPAEASEGSSDAASDADYDTAPPADDTSYLDAPDAPASAPADAAPSEGGSTSGTPAPAPSTTSAAAAPSAKTPGLEIGALIVAAGLVALAWRKRA